MKKKIKYKFLFLGYNNSKKTLKKLLNKENFSKAFESPDNFTGFKDIDLVFIFWI